MSSSTLKELIDELRKEARAYYDKQEGHPNLLPYHTKMRAALLLERVAETVDLAWSLSVEDRSSIRKLALLLAQNQHGPEPSVIDIILVRDFLKKQKG